MAVGAATVVEVVEVGVAVATAAVVAAVVAVVMEAEAVGVIDRSILPHGQGASQRGSLIDLPLTASIQRKKSCPFFSHLMSSNDVSRYRHTRSLILGGKRCPIVTTQKSMTRDSQRI